MTMMDICFALVLVFNNTFGCSAGSNQSVSTGFIGNEVLVPCIISFQLFEPVTAFWRDNGDKGVSDVIDSREANIDPDFKGHVFSFPDQYKNGNLSILIKDLRMDDAGLYQCHIPKVGYWHKITGSNQSLSTGFIGNEVLLPCIISFQLFEPVTAFWRDKGDKGVSDVIDSREANIDPDFKGHVFSFPDQYKNGSLSILIKDLVKAMVKAVVKAMVKAVVEPPTDTGLLPIVKAVIKDVVKAVVEMLVDAVVKAVTEALGMI